ncbi:MAG: hypothetical protein FWC95_03435 [Defluviitaleaceae bacterium]|nr:hypothetical protein [Defluviitaleaceae bacterium]
MIKLSDKELIQIGADFVLDALSPHTPYGSSAARLISPYKRSEAAYLHAELSNINSILKCSGDFNPLTAILVKFRDIRGSLHKLPNGKTLSDVDLFEIKSFTLSLHKLVDEFYGLNINLQNITFVKIPAALSILDPDGLNLPSFHISEKHSIKLEEIRSKKRLANPPTQEIIDEEYTEELRIRTELTKQLLPHHDIFINNITNITKLDLLLAKATLCRTYGCCMPIITENTVNLQGAYSPGVANTLSRRGRKFVPIDIRLAPGVTVITGANMGGKSLSLKTVALNCYLVQCGFFAFADEAALPMFDNIDFIFDDLSDVHAGLSSFGAEILRIDEIITKATDDSLSLILLDEPAKGTNPREGRAIAAGLTEFLNTLLSISVISTHYGNVGDKYRRYAISGLKSVKELQNPQDLHDVMDYRLIQIHGDADIPHDAINICKILRINNALLRTIEKNI